MTSTPGGYVKLFRSIVDWEWAADPNVLSVFVHIMVRVNREAKTWQGIAIPAGAFLTSRSTLAEKCGLTEKQVRRALDVLERADSIKRERAGFGLLVTLVNWAQYQEAEATKGRKKADRGAGSGPEQGRNRATTEEVREVGEAAKAADGGGDLFGGTVIDAKTKTTMRESQVGTWDVFKSLPAMRECEALGVDVGHYFRTFVRWSDVHPGDKRTAQGWVSSVEGAMERDNAAGKLVTLAGKEVKNEKLLEYLKMVNGQ